MSRLATSRIFHLSIKVRDLKETISFMLDVLGMHILKHEEKEQKCPINSNGPWNSAWSRTMIGYGEECETLVFEVTCNYGKKSYELGNDTKFFAIAEADIPTRALHRGMEVQRDVYGKYLMDPTGYKYLLVPGIPKPGVLFIGLNCADVENSIEFYCNHFATRRQEPNGVYFPGKDYFLQFHKASCPINPKETATRLCFGVAEVETTRDMFSKENVKYDLREHGPLKLFVAVDPDGHEICVVNTKQYLASIEPQSGDALINWDKRTQRESSAIPLQAMQS